LPLRDWLYEPLRQVWPWASSVKEIDLYENGNPEPAATAGVTAPKHGHVRRVLAGVTMGFAAMLGLSLTGVGTASAATHSAPAGGHVIASANDGGGSGSGGGGNGGGGGGGGTWDQTKVPLPHQPGQPPIFVLQSSTVADVVALDQTSEAAADASMIAFYQNNTACTAAYTPKPSVQDTITCPGGTATTTDAFAGGKWIHVFRLVN
jgi:hypothetical protein